MFFPQMGTLPKSISPLSSVNVKNNLLYVSPSPSFLWCSLYSQTLSVRHQWEHFLPTCLQCRHGITRFSCVAVLRKSDLESDDENRSKPKVRRKSRNSSSKAVDGKQEDEKRGMVFPTTIPRKPRRGRRSEAFAVEDFVRDSLDRTFASIQQQNPELLENKEYIMRERVVNKMDSETSGGGGGGGGEDEDEVEDDVGRRKRKTKKMVVEEEDPNWPLDADVGWGIRASEYFQKHPIKNVVGEDGVEIDWEGEIEDNWVNEINCLEWESFAFHPSPLIVLAFERYNRATDNWKTLKELEKAVKVYWSAKDRLPPRSAKIDVNIEKDLAYALKVKECPQILFLRGNRIIYREKDFRTADELVQMIAHFYYNAKKPPCVDDAALSQP